MINSIKGQEYKNLSFQAEEFESFLWKYYKNEIKVLALQYPDEKSLYVDFLRLDNFSNNLADLLLEDPDLLLDDFEHVIRNFDTISGITLDEAHLRIIRLPKKKKVKDIRIEDVGKLISIEGIITKATEVRPKITIAAYECPYCRHIFYVDQSEKGFTEPSECPQDGGCGRKAQKFTPLHNKSTFTNSQTIKIQDIPEELRGGELPQHIEINLEDDIAAKVYPGDHVDVVGIVRFYQRVAKYAKTRFFDIYIDGNSIEKREEEFEDLKIRDEDVEEFEQFKNEPNSYEKLIQSVAPSIYGYEEIKEALLLQLFGGVQKDLPDGTRLRGDIHILLVGDPGLAKSVLLFYVSKIAPRGLYVEGGGSSGVGLTAAAVKENDGGWSLEAGALVLADKGIVSIDEIDKMHHGDREKLHTGMEQQIISIAKAGITAKLNSRCSVLAAANPKYGRFDKYTAIAEQINMPPTLMSRFDLIFTMMDRPDEEGDIKLSQHILAAHQSGERENCESFKPSISADWFKKYIAYARRIRPELTEEAKNKIQDFFVGLRRQSYEDEEAPVPVTARQLEALIRLGEARARTRLSDKITAEDADRVINVVSYCLKHVFVDPETGKLDVDWINAGTTKTRRDRAKSIEEIIKQLEKEYGDEVPIEDVLDLAEEKGMDRDKAEDVIEVMKRDGTIFSPSGGVIRWAR